MYDLTPEQWLTRLYAHLMSRRSRYEMLARYNRGDHPLPEGDDRCRELFRKFQKSSRTNYCGLLVSSVAERLQVVGVRAGGAGTADQDLTAWSHWQANNLDSESGLVHETALALGEAYVIVGLNVDGSPLITGEDPRNVIAETSPVNRRVVVAALKTWDDAQAKKRYAKVLLPGGFYTFSANIGERIQLKTANRANDDANWTTNADRVFTFADDGLVWEFLAEEPNRLGAVPVVRFVNRPTLAGEGMAEFEDAIDIQCRINQTTLDRLVISKLQAYRQRWIKGVPSEDEDGNPLDLPFVPGVDLLWMVDAPDAEFGDFVQVDMTPILSAAAADVTAFVTITGLPPHYVAGGIVNAAADAIAAAMGRLIAKALARMMWFGESWEAVLRLAASWAGTEFAADSEIQWKDPERKTVAQLADAAVKKMAAGVPWQQRMEDLDYSPQQIQRMSVDRATDLILGLAASPAEPAPQVMPNGQ